MNNIIDTIHQERIKFARETGKQATTVIIGRRVLHELRGESYKANSTAFCERAVIGDDPSVFGMRIVTSNDDDEIAIAWELNK